MFSIHPVDLQRRRARCRPVVESLAPLPRESHAACNVCGSAQNLILTDEDRYGFRIRTAMCRQCGLIYMADRFTPDAYSEFYGSGAYRSLSCEFNGTRHKISAIQFEQLHYAAHAVSVLKPYVTREPGAQLLDVGGSTGTIARQFADHFGLSATVLDPAVREVAAARALGLNGVIGSVETYQTDQRYDVILLCRSIEHLCDLRGSLLKIRELLKPGGVFYCDIVDYLECCRSFGAPQVVSKMDHCYWLCQETAPAVFGALGFEIVSVDISFHPTVVGYVLRRAELADGCCSAAAVHQIMRHLRSIDAEWREQARVPLDLSHRFRRIGYRWKRRAVRAVSGVIDSAGALRLPDFATLRAALCRKAGVDRDEDSTTA